MTTGYELGPDERIVLKAHEVEIDGGKSMFGSRAELMLTSQNIVYPQKNMLGKIKGYHVWPLSDIRVIDGVAQCRLDSSEFMEHKLEVSFTHETVSFKFKSLENKKEVRAWVEEINQLVTGHSAPKENLKSAGLDAFMESDKFFDTVGNVLGTVEGVYEEVVEAPKRKYKEKFLDHTASVACPSCGASLEGQEGSAVTCPFCHTQVTIPLK